MPLRHNVLKIGQNRSDNATEQSKQIKIKQLVKGNRWIQRTLTLITALI